MQLDSIQIRNILNKVYTLEEKGNGGAYHMYKISKADTDEPVQCIQFQDGARGAEGSVDGCLDVDLLEIVRHRLICFNQGEFATRDTAIAIEKIEEALLWLNKRIDDRAKRKVLGTMQP